MNPDVQLELALVAFVKKVLSENEYDLIVPVERKGTALWRVLTNELLPSELRIAWPWEKVLASSAITFVNPSEFKGKRILLLDDMVFKGRRLDTEKSRIQKHAPEIACIHTAGFAVHEECTRKPDFFFYRSLLSRRFQEIREQFVQMLQRYGSLLLDTEHIEISVSLDNCTPSKFFSALALTCGKKEAVEFRSGGERRNLTLADPIVMEPESLQKLLPCSAQIDSVVKKCRVVERGNCEYAVIPIYYPNIFEEDNAAWLNNLPTFVDRGGFASASNTYHFYIAGLLASMELLKVVAGALYNLPGVRVEIRKSVLEHLVSIYPHISVSGLQAHLQSMFTVTAARKWANQLHERGRSAKSYAAECTVEDGLALLQEILALSTSKREILAIFSPEAQSKAGVALDEVLSLGDMLCLSRAETSTLIDKLIDDGYLVTNVEKRPLASNSLGYIRTFAVDGETVEGRLRRYTALRGRRRVRIHA